jgi:hypothetical protein
VKVTAFCDMATCSLVEVDPTFQRSILPPSSGLLHACSKNSSIFQFVFCTWDRLCGLVVSVENYKHRGPGFDSRALLTIFLRELGLERGPLSLVIG